MILMMTILIGDIFGGKARRPEKWSAEVCSTEAILLFFSSFQLAVQKAALMPYQEVSSSREEVEKANAFSFTVILILIYLSSHFT